MDVCVVPFDILGCITTLNGIEGLFQWTLVCKYFSRWRRFIPKKPCNRLFYIRSIYNTTVKKKNGWEYLMKFTLTTPFQKAFLYEHNPQNPKQTHKAVGMLQGLVSVIPKDENSLSELFMYCRDLPDCLEIFRLHKEYIGVFTNVALYSRWVDFGINRLTEDQIQSLRAKNKLLVDSVVSYHSDNSSSDWWKLHLACNSSYSISSNDLLNKAINRSKDRKAQTDHQRLFVERYNSAFRRDIIYILTSATGSLYIHRYCMVVGAHLLGLKWC